MDHPHRIPDRYIVRFNSDTRDPEVLTREIVSRYGGKSFHTFTSLKGFFGELPPEALVGLLKDPRVRYIEADVEMSPSTDVGDTTQYTGLDEALDRLDQRALPLNGTYEWSTDGTGVNLWIVDNGVDVADTDYAGRTGIGVSFGNAGNPWVSCNSGGGVGDDHGTDMARAAAGRTRGIARRATVHSANVRGNGCSFSSGRVAAAFEYIANYSPRPAVLNFSGTADCFWYLCPLSVDDAAGYAYDRGVVVVVGAGNGTANGMPQNACGFSPAKVQRIITVAAAGPNDQKTATSNHGSCIDIFATVNPGGGTSTAAAYVSGAAALKLQLSQTVPPSFIWNSLLASATTGVIINPGPGSPNRLLYTRQGPLSVTFHGATEMGPMTSCSWGATPQGGQPPYSTTWRRDGVVVSTLWDYAVSAAGPSSFGLSVSMVDGVGRTAFTGRFIMVDPWNTDSWCGGF